MVLIGTSGYSFPDWVGPFYPPGTTRAGMLDYYVQQFPAVEVNATYYRIPPPPTLAAMERKTPAGFEFVVKANAAMTHEGSADPALYDSFRRAIEPVARAGKLSGLLAQFPWAFRRGAKEEEHLRAMKRLLPDAPLFVEFRHKSWIAEDVFPFLEREGLGYVSVDEPDLPGLVPPVARATTEAAYVRFHGRNRARDRRLLNIVLDELSLEILSVRQIKRGRSLLESLPFSVQQLRIDASASCFQK